VAEVWFVLLRDSGREVVPRADQPLRVAVGQRCEQHAVDHREDGGDRPDPMTRVRIAVSVKAGVRRSDRAA
jgi:hypothetical protein